MKKITLLCFLLINQVWYSQCSTVKTEITTEGTGMMALLPKTKMKVTTYSKSNRIKIVVEGPQSPTATTFFKNDTMVILYEKVSECGLFRMAEALEDTLDEGLNQSIITDISIEKTKETKKILGHVCKKIIIRYKSANKKNPGMIIDVENIYWNTKEEIYSVQPNSNFNWESPKPSALELAAQTLGGTNLSSESITNGIKSVSIVTEINLKEIDNSVFDYKSKLCKKPLNYKDYKKLTLKRQKQAAIPHNQFNHFNNHGNPFGY